MDGPTQLLLREQLLDRRQRLQSNIPAAPDNAAILDLLKDVDLALQKLDSGTYGLCDVCHDPIERDRMIADPLTRYCIDHLTSAQQRALQQDLELAWKIQTELLPQPDMKIAGWDISSHYEPLGPVSGDYCDVIPMPDGGFFFSLGDVSGKGIAASMLMSHLHAVFRSLISVGVAFDQLLDRANRVFCESTLPTSFATLICGTASSFGDVEIGNAGHLPALVVRSSDVINLESTGLPIGMFCKDPISIHKLRMEPGETLLLYTDGLTESQNAVHEEYGTSRLWRIAADNCGLTPRGLITACLKDLSVFLGGCPKGDDLALLVLRRGSS